MDPLFLAYSKFRRRKWEECTSICTQMLEKNQLDEAVWYLKCKALTERMWIDDTEVEEEGVAEMLLDDYAIAQLPRPGTSLARPLPGSSAGTSAGIRPTTTAGRPLTGSQRPGSVVRTSAGVSVEAAFQAPRPNTSRPVTTSGRFVRLGTASLMNSDPGGPFVDVEKLKLRKYATRPPLAKVLFEYLLYHESNPIRALELASLSTTEANYKDWYWKAQLGKCYYKLGLLRDAEKQFKSSLKEQEMIGTYLFLSKIYIRLDQPNSAIDTLMKGIEKYPGELSLLLAVGRIHDALNDIPKSVSYYKKVLFFDSSNIEAIACLASNHFYTDQPELALRYYRRLLQMGVNNTELWTNLGLCCFYAQQYDMTLSCFERALSMAEDDNMADVWYNIGQVAIGIGDLGLAYQAFKIGVSVNTIHAESFNNLGVLELRKGNIEHAKSNFQTAAELAPHLHEPLFNGALLLYKLGDFQESYKLATKALSIYPEHDDAKEILKVLKGQFTTV